MKLTPEMVAALSKQDAQKLVQQKMSTIRELLDDCELVMNHHRFICDLPTTPMYHQLTFLPTNLTEEERQSVYGTGNNLHWAGINQDHKEGGVWSPSNEFGDCD